MNPSQKLLWSLYASAIGAVTTMVAVKAVNAAWEFATGEAPPEPSNPEVPLRRALTWAVASGVGVGVAQLLVGRFAAKQWTRAMGSPSGSFRRTTLDV